MAGRKLGGNAAAILLAAGMSAAQLVLPDNRPRLPTPPMLAEMNHRQRTRYAERIKRRADNEAGRLANRRKRKRDPWTPDDAQYYVQRMTNWQRNNWQRDPEHLDALGNPVLSIAKKWVSTPHQKAFRRLAALVETSNSRGATA